MKGKPEVPSEGARRSANSNSAPADRPADKTQSVSRRGVSSRAFHNLQARINADVRRIPGLHEFGN